MPFSEIDKLKALAIVRIFETGRPLGDYSAVAVLDDGAGISYGINQFTHKSGNLGAVLQRFTELGGILPLAITYSALNSILSGESVNRIAMNTGIKASLAELGHDPRMQRAQREIALEEFLAPAIEACEGSNFTKALSLAVIYDSQVHGSWEKIRDRVQVIRIGHTDEHFEKAWISEYVAKRDAWLESIPRLKKTDYRTDFFLAQIGRGNWDLNLPMNVHGYRLDISDLPAAGPQQSTPQNTPSDSAQIDSIGTAANPSAEAPLTEVSGVSEVAERPTLRRGSSLSIPTLELQKLLGIAPDGIFGQKTEAAVKLFQMGKGLTADGIVGPRTWKELLQK